MDMINRIMKVPNLMHVCDEVFNVMDAKEQLTASHQPRNNLNWNRIPSYLNDHTKVVESGKCLVCFPEKCKSNCIPVVATHLSSKTLTPVLNVLLRPEVTDADWKKFWPAINRDPPNDDFAILTALTSPKTMKGYLDERKVRMLATESWLGVLNPKRDKQVQRMLHVAKPEYYTIPEVKSLGQARSIFKSSNFQPDWW